MCEVHCGCVHVGVRESECPGGGVERARPQADHGMTKIPRVAPAKTPQAARASTHKTPPPENHAHQVTPPSLGYGVVEGLQGGGLPRPTIPAAATANGLHRQKVPAPHCPAVDGTHCHHPDATYAVHILNGTHEGG